MEPLIRETLNSVQLTPKVTNCPTFVNDAAVILAKGKSGNMLNASQGHYFAIHLACLKNSIELDAEYLQKRSTLTPKLYQSSVQFLLQTIGSGSIISSNSISKYYGSPDKMKEMIEEIQEAAKDSSPLASLAAAYQVTLLSGLKTCGTIGAIATLWAQPVDLLKESCANIKPFCDLKRIKEASKIISEEIRQTRVSKLMENEGVGLKRSPSPRLAIKAKREKLSSPGESGNDHHPLIFINCSCNGPAFGPILL